jgi:uncharacterized protein YunC (DUF1805 family)
MKGFFGVKGVIMLVAFIMLFGGAIYDLTTTSVRCGMAVNDPNSGYGCGELSITLVRTVMVPDDNVAKGVNGIKTLDNLDNETMSKLGIMYGPQRSSFMNQIILGLVGTAVLVLLLWFIYIKIAPSTHMDAGAYMVAFLAALFTISFIMVVSYSMVDDPTPEPGYLAVFGGATPFRGLRTLIANQGVILQAVDETSLLPGTLETGDIFNESDDS